MIHSAGRLLGNCIHQLFLQFSACRMESQQVIASSLITTSAEVPEKYGVHKVWLCASDPVCTMSQGIQLHDIYKRKTITTGMVVPMGLNYLYGSSISILVLIWQLSGSLQGKILVDSAHSSFVKRYQLSIITALYHRIDLCF